MVVTSPAGEAVRDYARAAGLRQRHPGPAAGHRPCRGVRAKEALADFAGTLLVVNGDMPLVTGETIAECLKAQARTGLALLAFEAADPGAYGRVLLTPDGFLDRIVEYKDATAVRTRHHPVQCRLLCRRRAEILPLGRRAEQRQCPEGILPDRCAGAGRAAKASNAPSRWPTKSRSPASTAAPSWRRPSGNIRRRMRARMLADGVTMTAPETVFFAHDTVVENDVEIEPFVVFGPGVTVQKRRAAAQPFPSGRRHRRLGRHHRALCAPAARRARSAKTPISAISWK